MRRKCPGILSVRSSCVKLQLRGRLLAHLYALGPLYIAGEHCGELITSVVEGIDALDPYVSQYLPQCALAVIAPAMILIAIFFLDRNRYRGVDADDLSEL